MDQNIEGSIITFMGDPAAEFTSDLDMKMTHPGPISVGIIGRCKRHAIYAEDSVVKHFAISESADDPAGDEDPEGESVVDLKTEFVVFVYFSIIV